MLCPTLALTRARAAAVVALLALMQSACSLPLPRDGMAVHTDREVFGHSRDGRPVEAVILTPADARSPRRTYLLLGVVHGNEPLGRPVLQRFIERIEKDPTLLAGARLVIVPVLNPDGLARRTRANSRGVDLNRNLPARNWTRSRRHGSHPASEPETRALLKIIRQFQPDRVLAIHSPLYCVNWDGPAEHLARAMASASGYPLRPSIGYPTPGSLGSYSGVDHRVPTITLELERGVAFDTAWEASWPALLAFVGSPRWRAVAAARDRPRSDASPAAGK